MPGRPKRLPIVDVGPLLAGGPGRLEAAAQFGRHLREVGFVQAVGHGLDPGLLASLDAEARRFFARPEREKAEIAMSRGGRAWRGWFPLGGELTSGRPDLKEGLYFGSELGDDHPLVRAGTPLHGPNLFPADQPALRRAVLRAIDGLTRVGHGLVRGIALALGLDESFFDEHYTSDPLVLFRIFRYPAQPDDDGWGVGEHTDYGFLTLLLQDDRGGLEIRTPDGWLDAEPVPGAIACNVGDMLERLTCGHLRSTPHRVRNRSSGDRLSFPFFFDPSWHAAVRPIEALLGSAPREVREGRWDGANLREIPGTYGEYVLSKVSRVFPGLRREVLPTGGADGSG